MPVFTRWEVRSKIAVPVVSEPVPAVVGMAIRGLRAWVMGCALPSGAGMKAWRGTVGWLRQRFRSLVVSITEPPPTARKAVGL